MNRYTLNDFLEQTSQKDHQQGTFELETERFLEINLNGKIWIKTGAMVAYRGNMKFTREGILEHGIGKLLKKTLTGEGARLTSAEGSGQLYLADKAKQVHILNLDNETIYVNGNDLLAFEPSIQWDIKIMKKVTAMLAGGLFNVRLEGTGIIAITTHFKPLTLMVTPENPVMTDPNATVAWSGSLTPEFKADVSLRTFIGRTSGETFQMKFQGNGFVIVQPYEEQSFQRQAGQSS